MHLLHGLLEQIVISEILRTILIFDSVTFT